VTIVAFSHDELDRFVDETRDRGVITGDVYCGNCGYNLKTLPYVYRCPECGSEYCARRLFPRGIFYLSRSSFPYGELIAFAITVLIAVSLGYAALRGFSLGLLNRANLGMLGLAGLFGWTAVRIGRDCIRSLVLLRKTNGIRRRIAEEKESYH